jgi:CDP-paratose 2-epimerase
MLQPYWKSAVVDLCALFKKKDYMRIALITGSSGLIGSESVHFFADKFDVILGIDNNMRAYFFGKDASTASNQNRIAALHTN